MARSPADMAETSKAGLRRMRRLAAKAPILGTSQTAAIHHQTSQLIYPASTTSPHSGHLITSLYSPSRPRPLPTPPVLGPSRCLSISHDGSWVVIFHSDSSSLSGTLAIYSSSILSPAATNNTVIPFSTLSLPSEPLDTLHLYPPRLHLLAGGRAPPIGPRPPVGYNPSRGPTFLLLLPTHILLVHPRQTTDAIRSDGLQSASDQNPSSQGWGMGVLRCPLNKRWHASAAEPETGMGETGWKVRSGWMGLVPREEGAWIGWERRGEAGVVRAEIGVDTAGRRYMQVIPMPPLPKVRQVPEDAPQVQTLRSLQSIAFVPLPDKLPGGAGTDEASPLPGVAAVLVYQETTDSGGGIDADQQESHMRTRLETVGFHRQEVELAEGFAEVSPGNGDVVKSWDWFTLVEVLQSSTSPGGTMLLALVPLVSLPPNTLALALLLSPSGLSLAHIDLDSSSPGESELWGAIRGTDRPLGEFKDHQDFLLVPSQGAARGGTGLVGSTARQMGASLHIVPSLEASHDLPDIQSMGIDSAATIVAAMRQGVDWSDVIRAALASVARAEQSALVSAILSNALASLAHTPEIFQMEQIVRLQVALYASLDDPRKDLAVDLVFSTQASRLFSQSSSLGKDGISFDIDSIWPLLGVAEWAMSLIAGVARDSVLLKAELEWDDADDPLQSQTYSRVLYMLHPHIRPIILRLLAQVRAYSTFILSLQRPILSPESRFFPSPRLRDPRATILAQDQAQDLGIREGLEIELWGKALELLPLASDPDSGTSFVESLLELSLEPIKFFVLPALAALPDPSSLFLAQPGEEQYDAITFQPLPPMLGDGAGFRCIRCGRRTLALQASGGMGGTRPVLEALEAERGAWTSWRMAREEGCACGGGWTR